MKRDHSVAEKSEVMGAVVGQPISHETNFGLRRREAVVVFEDFPPGDEVDRAGWKKWYA